MSVTITRGPYCESLQKALKEALCRVGIASRLNENIEHDTILIDGTPEIVLHALDQDEDFMRVPLIPWPWPPTPQAVGETCCELLAPAPDGLVGDDGASLSQEQLNIPQAETEHVVEPDGVADDLGGKPVAIGSGGGFIPPVSPTSLQGCQTRLP